MAMSYFFLLLFPFYYLFMCVLVIILTLAENCSASLSVCLLTGRVPVARWKTRCEVSYIHRRVEPCHHSINGLIKPSGLNQIRGSQLVRKKYA